MPTLLSPIELDSMEIKNRIVIPPMATGLAEKDGEPSEELIQHYVDRSEDVGLVVVEHSYVSSEGKFSENQLGIHTDSIIPKLKNLANSIREMGSVPAIQINHAGGKSRKDETNKNPVSPSSKYFEEDENIKILDKDGIERIENCFVNAARRAVEAGFEVVEIHGSHGFLINQFTSPISNDREDEYGGKHENRIKFPLEIAEKICNKYGKEIKIMYRLGATDRDPKGFNITNGIDLAEKLVDKGIDIIDVSGGMCGSRPSDLDGEVQGYFIPEAERIKDKLSTPVIGVGGIKDPIFANKLVKDGKVDMVAVGRAILRDPKWASKAVSQLKK